MRSLPSSDPTGAVFEGRKIRAPARARRGRRRFMHMIRARAPVAVRSRPAVHVAVLNFAEGHLAPRARARVAGNIISGECGWIECCGIHVNVSVATRVTCEMPGFAEGF